jgi:hypothetical protein
LAEDHGWLQHAVGDLGTTADYEDSMSFGLTRMVVGSPGFLEITEDEYRALATAKDGLLKVLFLEQKFDLLVQTYLEFETELLQVTEQQILNRAPDWHWFQDRRAVLNRRLVSVLSAARAYLDHREYAIHVLLSADARTAERCRQRRHEIYDSTVGYRVMEALRNHTQHHGFPIHAVEFVDTLIDSAARNRVKCTLAVYTKTSYLAEDSTFKAKVLTELQAMGGRVDLKPLVRDYVAGLADLHEVLRTHLAGRADSWERTIESAIVRFQAAYPGERSLIGLAAVEAEGASRSGVVQLFRDFMTYRRDLVARNSGLEGLGRAYVSGEAIRDAL